MKPPSDDPFSDILPTLLDFMEDSFSLDEVEKLSFEMEIDYDEYAGDTKSKTILGLIKYCQRRFRHG